VTKLGQKRLQTNRLDIRGVVRLAGLVLVAASVIRELRLPKEKRTWHGVVFRKVPYELRPPTLERLKATFWNPDSPDVVMPTAFGVGCSLNLGALCTKCLRPTAV
jgi:hypothetical protein